MMRAEDCEEEDKMIAKGEGTVQEEGIYPMKIESVVGH